MFDDVREDDVLIYHGVISFMGTPGYTGRFELRNGELAKGEYGNHYERSIAQAMTMRGLGLLEDMLQDRFADVRKNDPSMDERKREAILCYIADCAKG